MVVDDSDIRNLGNNQKTLWRMKRLMRLLPVGAHPYFGNQRHAEFSHVTHQPRQALRNQFDFGGGHVQNRSEEHTSELQSLMRISYAVFCLKKKKTPIDTTKLQPHYKPTST